MKTELNPFIFFLYGILYGVETPTMQTRKKGHKGNVIDTITDTYSPRWKHLFPNISLIF